MREVLIRRFGVLSERLWTDYEEFEKANGYMLSKGRKNVAEDPDQVRAAMALAIIFGVSKDSREAILLDRKGRILDGVQRLNGFRALPDYSFYSVMLDYEHPDDQIPVF